MKDGCITITESTRIPAPARMRLHGSPVSSSWASDLGLYMASMSRVRTLSQCRSATADSRPTTTGAALAVSWAIIMVRSTWSW